jgi:glycosyltransferase involved in cell wall biosynthesis
VHVLQVGPLYVNHLRRWAEHSVANGCTVSVAGHVRPERSLADLTDVADRIEVAPEGLWDLGTARRVAWLRDVLRRLEPDLIQAHWLPTWAYFAALSGRRPLIVTPWGSDLYLATGTQRTRADRALGCADVVFARSCHMERAILARGVPSERVHRVDLGVDVDRFRPASPREVARLRRELELPSGPIIISTRAGTALYNLEVVVDAFCAVRTQLPQATLLMVHGDASLSRSVRTALRGLDRDSVRVVGNVPHTDISKYLKVATAGVSIPSSDGSPSSVWESLACGVPMVLSDLPQIDERVGASGAVRLVDPRPDAVAAALYEIVAHPPLRDRMSHAGRAWAEANADQREQIERLGTVYAAMTKGSPARAPTAIAFTANARKDQAAGAHPDPS